MHPSDFRILVVDDDDDTRGLYQNFLEYEGFTVDTVNHPSLIRAAERYAAILMDVHFGGAALEGADWVRQARATGGLTDATKVVFATGFALDASDIQPDELLLKPIELTALRKLLAEVL